VIAKLTEALPEAVGPSAWGITCSIGVVTFADAAVSPERAIAAADDLMYEVKRRGKGAVAFRVFGEGVQPRGAGDPEAGRR